MDQQKPAKTGFVIKLSSETVQKLKEVPPTNSNVPIDPPNEKAPPAKANSEINEPPSAESVLTVDTGDKDRSSKVDDPESAKSESIENKDFKSQENKPNSEWGDYAPYVTYEGEIAIYTDPNTNAQYVWDTSSSVWAPRSSETPEVSGRVYSFENDTHVYTEADGSKFFWDADKKAWIPKVDDDFLAMYQMSYGFIDNTTREDTVKEVEKTQEESKSLKRKAPEPPKWFDAGEENNTKVYVSNLPEDLTEEEFVDFMQKCGLVMRDPSSQKMKVKLYMDKDNNCFKGDALCTYIKIESVELALKLLDGSDLKGKTISVQRAKFQMKGDYNPALKPKKKKKKELEKIKRMQEKLFDWRPEKVATEKSKNERVVIIKNLFHPTDFDKEVQLILDYQQDLREECTKCGEVRKIVLYDRHPEGVAQVTMKEPEQATAVVALINGRWFGKRMLSAEIWDGRTKYRIAETDADMSKRVDKWEKFLEGADEDKGEGSEKKEENIEESDVNKPGETVEKECEDKGIALDEKTSVVKEKNEA